MSLPLKVSPFGLILSLTLLSMSRKAELRPGYDDLGGVILRKSFDTGEGIRTVF
jgi:hypothetical protein